MITAAVGVALTGLLCEGYIWKAADPSRGIRRLFWEPESLYAVTVLEFLILGAFILRAAIGARGISALVWVIFLLFVFNIVFTVALLGFPAY